MNKSTFTLARHDMLSLAKSQASVEGAEGLPIRLRPRLVPRRTDPRVLAAAIMTAALLLLGLATVGHAWLDWAPVVDLRL